MSLETVTVDQELTKQPDISSNYLVWMYDKRKEQLLDDADFMMMNINYDFDINRVVFNIFKLSLN